MKISWNAVISAIMFIVLMLAFSLKVFGIELKTAAQDSSPKFYMDAGGSMAGICVDILKAIDKEAGLDINISGYDYFIPARRYKVMLEKGQLDLMCGLSKNPEREKKFKYIDIPLYQVKHLLVSRKELDLQIKSIDDVHNNRLLVLSIHGTGTAKYGKRIFGDNLYSSGINNPEVLLKMLISNRGDLAYYHNLGLLHQIKKSHLSGKVIIHPVVPREYSHYLVMSREVPQDIVGEIYGLVNKLKKDGSLDKIFSSYVVEPVSITHPTKKIKMLETIPKDRSLSYGEIIHVENDGRCQPGEIIKVTGGKHTEGIRRKYECIKRPEK